MEDAAIIVFSFVITSAVVATIQQQDAAEWYRRREAECQNDSELGLVQESTVCKTRSTNPRIGGREGLRSGHPQATHVSS
jgi:hypothetical protein